MAAVERKIFVFFHICFSEELYGARRPSGEDSGWFAVWKKAAGHIPRRGYILAYFRWDFKACIYAGAGLEYSLPQCGIIAALNYEIFVNKPKVSFLLEFSVV